MGSHQDAETYFLAILAKNPDSLQDVYGIREYMFSSLPLQNLFSNLKRLSDKNIVYDKNLLIQYLESSNNINECGGIELINYLYSLDVNRDNVKNYEEIIISNFKTRKFVSLVSEAKNVANSSNINDVMSSLRSSIDSLDISGLEDSVSNIDSASEFTRQNLIERMKTPGARGYKLGVPVVDTIIGGISGGDVFVIGSRPSMGKSALMCNAILNSSANGVDNLAFSLEMRKDVLVERMIAISSGLSVSDLRLGLIDQKKLKLVDDAIEKLNKLPVHLDCTYTPSNSYIMSTIRKFVRTYGTGIVHIDYIQLLVERGATQTQDLGILSRDMKLLANELNIGIVLYSQLNRMVELREDKRPILSDLRQSGNLEEDADIAAFLYRDENYNPASKDAGKLEFIIRKNRNGPVGTVILKFNAETNKLDSITNGK